jgi:hypothetical protein
MTPFRTEFSISPSLLPIELSNQIITTGSCFADDLGKWLKENKFTVEVNPFGTTYNPVSIHRALLDSIHQKEIAKEELIESNESWYHFDFHSQWSSHDESILASKLNQQISRVGEQLRKTNTIIITYGTSWVYEHISSNHIVSNCHKIPGKNFKKYLLSEEQIVSSFRELFVALKKINSEIRFILTVSPVRHLKDTVELNQVSKSILRLACHTIVNQFDAVEYFPSYEIMMDDLRDYRFYKEDMIHPSDVAVEYIAQKFSDRYFTKATKETLTDWNQIKKAIEHKPFQDQSSAHTKFLNETLNKLEAIKHRINVQDEIQEVKKRLASSTMA